MTIDIEELENCYKVSLGDDGARALINKAILIANLPRKHFYSKEEALKICNALQCQPGFVAIVGGIVASRIIVRN